MTQTEILYEFKQMPIQQQLETLRAALAIVESRFKYSQAMSDEKLPLAEAAKLLMGDYETDGELTSFTALDGEDIYVAW